MIIPNILSNKGPLFKESFYITRPNLPEAEEVYPYIKKMIESRWVTNFGKYHEAFSEEIKKRLGVKYVLPCCNATIGLLLLIEALELKGKVITTPFTFPATVHSITMAGLEPVFCDIDKDEYTIDTKVVERLVTKGAAAVLAVNVFGNICDVDDLDRISLKYNIPVIYDSAHAFLASYKGKKVGGFGRAEVFSFHATKFFTTLEGGVITTNDEQLYKKLRLLINFGIKDEENVTGIGLNGKMSEMNAIFGILSFQKADKNLKKLKDLNKIYKEELAGIPGLKMQKINRHCKPNNQYMPVEIIGEEFGLTRDDLHKALKMDNVITRKYFYPSAERYECYREKEFVKNAVLENVNTVTGRVLCLPLYASMEVSCAKKICGLVKSIRGHSKEVKAKLKCL